ncbi:FKBP-type peptidyl-prolyl cis-trans isomerase [Halodesulfurarchaeum sp.]|uniref:FKBP-type peptidyl-prolyl cis-trans isomerase n=1 Tax=Halodesulfurarchaeum sp. TaxID=1980530 RepID=UPI002FC2C057
MSDEQTADSADDTAEDAGTAGLQDGDFVKVAYTAHTVESGDLVDTTDESVAEEEGVDTDEQEFAPRTIVLGEGHLFPGVESDIVGSEVGAEGTVEIPAGEAFGEYDEEEVRTVSADKIPEDDRYPGAHVDLDGQHGHVETIIGGRARVDFNHPLAGDDVEYEYEILDTIDDRVEKAKGLLETYFDVDLDMHIETDEVEEEVEVDGETEDDESETEVQAVDTETLYIESAPELQFDQQWMMSKQQILGDIIEKIDIDRVIVQEIIDGTPAMPGMGGMGGGLGDVEAQLEDADVDADEIMEELDVDDLDEE